MAAPIGIRVNPEGGFIGRIAPTTGSSFSLDSTASDYLFTTAEHSSPSGDYEVTLPQADGRMKFYFHHTGNFDSLKIIPYAGDDIRLLGGLVETTALKLVPQDGSETGSYCELISGSNGSWTVQNAMGRMILTDSGDVFWSNGQMDFNIENITTAGPHDLSGKKSRTILGAINPSVDTVFDLPDLSVLQTKERKGYTLFFYQGALSTEIRTQQVDKIVLPSVGQVDSIKSTKNASYIGVVAFPSAGLWLLSDGNGEWFDPGTPANKYNWDGNVGGATEDNLVSFDANGNIKDSTFSPTDLLANPARIFFVATDGDDTDGDGSVSKPYLTVQKGYDEAAALSPTQANPAAVCVFPGEYDETLIIDNDHVALIGTGGQQVTNIRASTGPSVIISNATRASILSFLSAGGQADPDSNYGILSAGTDLPRNVQIRDITIGDYSGSGYELMVMGVGDGTSFLGDELNIMGCCVWQDVYCRLANYIAVQGAAWVSGKIHCHNVAGVWVNDSQISGYEGFYNTAEDEPSDGGNYGLCGGKTLCNGAVTLTGSARAGAGDPNGGLVDLQITGNLDLDDTSSITMIRSGVGGNLDAEASASFNFKDVHVQGDVTIADGVGTAQMDGGQYMGILTDVGDKLNFNIAKHAATHEKDGVDEVIAENLAATSSDTDKRFGPDGSGGVSVLAALPVYSQADAPALVNGDSAIWVDTDDSNRVYLVYQRGTGDQVSVELT